MSDPKVEEIRARRAAWIVSGKLPQVAEDIDHLLAKLDEAEKANAWDGEWRTIPQTETEARRVLMTWTKALLVNFHIAAWQRELQRDEFWRWQLTTRAEAAEKRERVLLAGVKEVTDSARAGLADTDDEDDFEMSALWVLERLPSTPTEAGTSHE